MIRVVYNSQKQPPAPFVLVIFGITIFTLRKARGETKLTLPVEPTAPPTAV